MAGTTSELIALLEREATAEREQLVAEARTQAEAVRAQVRQDAEVMLSEARSRLEVEARAATVKAQSTAQLHAASMILQAKEAEIARVFAEAEAELAKLPGDPERFPPALRMFVEEALVAFPGQALLSVNPSDEQVVSALARLRGWNVQVNADSSVRGGVRVAAPDGRFVVINTLASRLERARPALAADVARMLWA